MVMVHKQGVFVIFLTFFPKTRIGIEAKGKTISDIIDNFQF